MLYDVRVVVFRFVLCELNSSQHSEKYFRFYILQGLCCDDVMCVKKRFSIAIHSPEQVI
jgi:hypothetical protein